jgi:FkbM family methyltransferase
MSWGDWRWKLKVLRSRLWNYSRYVLRAPLTYRNWFQVLATRNIKEPGVLHLRNGLHFKVRPRSSDRGTINENFILKPYLLDERFAISATDRVLDVGANIGAFTVAAASKARNGVVYAVEPVSDNLRILENNIALNALTNVTMVRAAVGAAGEPVAMALKGASSTAMFEANDLEHEQVDQVSLESLLEQMGSVDLLKMDCEGAEFDIFFSTRPAALLKIRRIAMEYHNVSAEKNVRTLRNFLETNGFEVTVVGKDWTGLLFAIRR